MVVALEERQDFNDRRFRGYPGSNDVLPRLLLLIPARCNWF